MNIKRFWQRWKELAPRIAAVQARILLSIFYFTVLFPFGVVMTLWQYRNSEKKRTAWQKRERGVETLEMLRQQYS